MKLHVVTFQETVITTTSIHLWSQVEAAWYLWISFFSLSPSYTP